MLLRHQAAGVVQLYDALDSTSTTLALTAAQGKALQDEIDALAATSNLTFAGTLDASTGLLLTVSTAGSSAGFGLRSSTPFRCCWQRRILCHR